MVPPNVWTTQDHERQKVTHIKVVKRLRVEITDNRGLRSGLGHEQSVYLKKGREGGITYSSFQHVVKNIVTR